VSPFVLAHPVAVSITGNCASLDRHDVADKTLIVRNANVCRGRQDALLRLLSSAQPGDLRAIVGFDDPSGDRLPPNFALLSQAQTPPYLRNRSPRTAIYIAGSAWVGRLAEQLATTPIDRAALHVSTNYVAVPETGQAIAGSVALGHMAVNQSATTSIHILIFP